MITERVCQWEFENESVAEHFEAWYKKFYKTVWRKGCVVYWIDESTD